MLDQRPDFRLLAIVSTLGFAQSSSPITFLVDLVLDPPQYPTRVKIKNYPANFFMFFQQIRKSTLDDGVFETVTLPSFTCSRIESSYPILQKKID